MTSANKLFVGAAPFYSKYIVPYPSDFFDSVVRVCKLDPDSLALDLGAGTGQIAIPLAKSVRTVLAVDPSEEMIREGVRVAEGEQVNNVEFVVSTSEELQENKKYDIATSAGAFHWMDRPKVLEKMAKILKPNGCVAIIDRERDKSEPNEWFTAMWDDIKDFWEGQYPAGPTGVRPVITVSNRTLLTESAFSEVTELRHYYRHDWELDGIIGYLQATSKGTSGTLGNRHQEFYDRVRKLLMSYSPDGKFVEEGHVSTLIGFRP